MQPSPQNWRAWPVEAKVKMLERLKAMPTPAPSLEAQTQPQWLECASDASYFIDSYVIIDEPQGDGISTLPFHLWPAQIGVLTSLVTDKLLIILKARQLGISWLCCAYVLWLCLFKPGRVALFLSKGQVEAQELTRRVRVMYGRLPDWMRQRVPLIADNTEELRWANDSRVQSMAATKNAGRSFTASVVLMDEFAFMAYGEDVYTAIKPTVDAGGQLILLSTANGEGDKFHELWKGAVALLNSFKAIFLSWRARPGRTDEWRAKVAAEALDPAKDLQEYPDTPEEAFQSTGGDRYLPSIALWDACRDDSVVFPDKWPMVLAADAGVTNDCFALVGVSRHPVRPTTDAAVRLVIVYEPRGKELDFDAIEADIMHLLATFNVVQFAYDAYQLHQMGQRIGQKIWARKFSQQTDRMIADSALLQRIMRKDITHDGNAQLRAHLDNANRKAGEDAKTIRIEKRETSKKVDLAVALSMGCHEVMRLNL